MNADGVGLLDIALGHFAGRIDGPSLSDGLMSWLPRRQAVDERALRRSPCELRSEDHISPKPTSGQRR
jgi:hypothetical protein